MADAAKTDRSRETGKVVLHVAQSVETGVAHVLDEHLRYQREHGWRTVVACPSGTLAGTAARAGADVVPWHATREPSPVVVRETVELAHIIADTDPDILHLHSAKAGLAGRLAARGRRPTVFTPHAWSWLAAEGVTRTLARRWEQFGARWADAVVCLSNAELDAAHTIGIPARATRLIANDVNVEALRRTAPPTRSQARAALDVARDIPVAVCCARLVPQKGQDVLLDAWASTVAAVPDALLVLVGDGPDRPALEKKAADIGAVRFAGMQPRPAAVAWMKAASVVVCPSRYEGMSLVPLEAAALGVPVVASRVQGMDSDLPPTARRLVPAEDIAALATALVDMLEDPVRLDAAGRTAAEWAARTQDNASVARTLHLYGELLGRRRRSAGAEGAGVGAAALR